MPGALEDRLVPLQRPSPTMPPAASEQNIPPQVTHSTALDKYAQRAEHPPLSVYPQMPGSMAFDNFTQRTRYPPLPISTQVYRPQMPDYTASVKHTQRPQHLSALPLAQSFLPPPTFDYGQTTQYQPTPPPVFARNVQSPVPPYTAFDYTQTPQSQPLPAYAQNFHQQTLPPATYDYTDTLQNPSPYSPAPVPQTLPAMSQYGQEQASFGVDNMDEAMLGQQDRIPAFFELSSSLPMSTFTTKLSPPSQTPKKRPRKLIEDIQDGNKMIHHRTQNRASHRHAAVASLRSRQGRKPESLPSRRGFQPPAIPAYRPRRCPLHEHGPEICRGPGSSTNPAMSAHPPARHPSPDWFGHPYASGVPMNRLSSFDNRQSQAAQQFQSTLQSPIQIGYTFAQSDVQGPVVYTATTGFNACSSTISGGIQPFPEATSNIFETVGAQEDYMEPVNGPFPARGNVMPGGGQAKIPSPPEEIHWNDENTSATGTAGHPKTNFPSFSAEPLSAEDESYDNNIPDLTYLEEVPQAEDDGIANQDIPTLMADATNDSEDILILQPVIDYVYGKGYSEGTPGHVASSSIAESDGNGLGSTGGEASTRQE